VSDNYNLKARGERVRIYPGAVLIGAEHIEIASDVIIDSLAIIVAGPHAPVKIGNFVHIASHVTISGGPVELADFTNISSGARLVAGTDDFSGHHLIGPTIPAALRKCDRKGITTGKQVIVGANAVILPGVLPEGTAIGAGSVVTHRAELVPMNPWQIWAGNPARFIKPRARGIAAATAEGVREYAKVNP
jgi:acetyltransferase-like isoleucine patch superfamily enzyme